MFDVRFVGAIGCLVIAGIALILLMRERTWARDKYRKELKMTILQPDFIASLRKELEKDVQTHVKAAIAPLTKEVGEVVADAKKQTLANLDESLKENRAALREATEEQVAVIKNLVAGDAGSLQQSMVTLQKDIEDLQQEHQAVLADYRTKVLARVKTLVDEQAADLLADYLQSSLQGLELGDQQEFILARLDANKDALFKELGND